MVIWSSGHVVMWSYPTLSRSLEPGRFDVMYPHKFFQFYRRSVAPFDGLVGLISGGLIGDFIAKRDTAMRINIRPAEGI